MARATSAAALGPQAEEASQPWPVWGQARDVASLRQAIASGRISHAFLLSGPSGVGKRAMAFAFAQAVLCQAPDRRDRTAPCGGCAACRRIARGAYP
ncbi:MAG TPA: hypothetical protein VFU81_19885, partial [Thermomicrobiales bacterium]|nr:hypothetical protein [Thermomicrobiales bacterium]